MFAPLIVFTIVAALLVLLALTLGPAVADLLATAGEVAR